MAIITHIKNPFDPINSRDVVLKNGGKALYKYFDRIEESYEIVASINGQIVDNFEVIINNNDSVSFLAIPQGGEKDKQVLSIVAMVALSMAAPGMAGAIASSIGVSGAVGTAIIQGGIMIAGGMIINSALPPATPDFGNPSMGSGYSNSNTYSWGTQANSTTGGVAIPLCYGINRIVPPLISHYVETVGNKQYLNMLFALNDGEIESTGDVMINDNPSSYYNDVSIETRLGTNSQALIGNFDNTRADTSVNAVLSDSSYVTRQLSGNLIDEIIITLTANGGLYRAEDNGTLSEVIVPVTIEYREIGSATWISQSTEPWVEVPAVYKQRCIDYRDSKDMCFEYESYLFSSAIYSTSPFLKASQSGTYRKTFILESLTPAHYEVRVKRDTTESSDTRTSDKVYFEVLSEVIYDDFTYPNTALMSVRALATDQLNGQMPKVSCIVIANNDNPSLIVQDILTRWSGVSTENISSTDFDAWESFCVTNSYTCNMVFDTAIDLRQALDSVSQLGRAMVTRFGATYLPLIDKVDDLPTQGFFFTMGNIIENSFKEDYIPTLDRSNVLEITYFDQSLDYERQSFEIFQNGFDESTSEIKKSSIALYGCTNREMALKHGRYILNKSRYLTNTVSFEVSMDAIVCRAGDIIRVAHDVPQWGYSGRLTSDVASTILTLDKEITILDNGTSYAITIRLSTNDEIVNKNIIVPSGGYVGNEVTIDTTFSTLPSKFDIYSFGELDKTTKEFRVLNITRSSDQLRKVTALEYISEVYNDNTDIIEIENKSSLENVYNLQSTDAFLIGSTTNNINISWMGNAISWDVYYKLSTDTEYILAGSSTVTSFQIVDKPLGTYDIRVADKVSQVILLGDTKVLPDITNLISYYRNEQTVLTWDILNDLRTPIDYEIRLGTDWDGGIFLTRISTLEFVVTADETYMIKGHFKSQTGADVYSENEVQAVVSNAVISKNIVSNYDEKISGWLGTKTSTFVNDDGYLQMVADGVFDNIPDFDALISIDYYGDIVAEASYEIPTSHIVNVGASQQCRLWVDYEVSAFDTLETNTIADVPDFDLIASMDGVVGVSKDYAIVIQVSTAGDDDVFADWKNFNAGDYIGKKFKFRVLFYSLNVDVTVILKKAIFYVDMLDKIQSNNNVTIDSAGQSITYPVAFQVTPSTNITIANASDGDEIKLTSESASGFTVQVRNSGSGVTKVINWLSKGY